MIWCIIPTLAIKYLKMTHMWTFEKITINGSSVGEFTYVFDYMWAHAHTLLHYFLFLHECFCLHSLMHFTYVYNSMRVHVNYYILENT